MLQRLSSEFNDLPAHEFDVHIVNGLRQLVQGLHVQRASLAEVDDSGRYRITHAYAVRGSHPLEPAVSGEAAPPFDKAQSRARAVRLATEHALSKRATGERHIPAATGIKSDLSLPFSVGGEPVCVLSVGSARERAWPDQLLPYLKQAGEIFAGALARKREDAHLRKIEMQLAQLARVSTMGQLAGSIAHEVNQPLCAIVSNAQAALSFVGAAPPETDQAVAAISDIIRDGKRASEIISRTNLMLRRHPVSFTSHDLNELVMGVLPLIERYASLRRVTVTPKLSSDLPHLMCDAVQVQQVMVNLIVNGIDAISPSSDGQGCVRIQTLPEASAHEVTVRVSDNGVGLSPMDQDHIFEAFYTSKQQGLGMGLAISKTIVEAHGGRLWAEPNAIRGASFSFALPTQKEIGHDDRPTTGDGDR